MAEEDFTAATIEMYGQIFQKPKMTDKLLKKPPFRYLHDIFTATLKATNFGKGLFEGHMLNSKEITEKEDKLKFLTNLITLTELVIGEELDVKPQKIVTGQEPEKTNTFLQAMAQAATAGIDTTPHVNQVLGIDDGGEDEGGDPEAEARAQQEAQMRAQQEEADKAAQKKAARKKKQQQEEQARQQQEQEEAAAREAQEQQRAHEENKKKKRAQKEQEQQQQRMNLMREGDDEEEEDNQMEAEQPQQFHAMEAGDNAGYLHKKAAAMMQEDDDAADANPPAETEDTGPKIKMGRVGKGKKKKPQAKGGETKTDMDSGHVGLSKANTAGFSGGAGFTEQDVEFMKKAIQVLCQSTNPLGKSIDFVTDDVDSMSKEYERWRKESIQCQTALEEQQKITEECLQPLQDQLAELEEKTKDQQSKINSVRSQVMRNDITIQNLLYSVIQSR